MNYTLINNISFSNEYFNQIWFMLHKIKNQTIKILFIIKKVLRTNSIIKYGNFFDFNNQWSIKTLNLTINDVPWNSSKNIINYYLQNTILHNIQ